MWQLIKKLKNHFSLPLQEKKYVDAFSNTLEDQIHGTIRQIFKNPKKGYNWLLGHFHNVSVNSASTQEKIDMLDCLWSKRNGIKCAVHRRIHVGKKGTRL